MPVQPPVEPMLARLTRDLPEGDGWWFEPKWDGFRCLAFRDGDDVDLRSRNQRPLARYFPEVVDGLRSIGEPRIVLDGELMAVVDGRFEFPALMARLHPAASRVARLAGETPAVYVAFDLLAAGDDDLRTVPFAERRRRLEGALAGAHPAVRVTPATRDHAEAQAWLDRHAGHGIDGVVAKAGELTYQPGKRAMVKVKPDRVADCVVAGVRLYADGPVSSLLLGLYDAAGELRHVGVASSFTNEARFRMVDELRPYVTELAGHPWERGFALEGGPMGRLKGAAGRWTPDMAQDWMPLRPDLVCEVAYDQVDGHRFRHPVRFRRWRTDRSPSSCTVDQLT